MRSHLEQERVTKVNRKSANACLTDMINIYKERFKSLLNEINQMENKNSFIIICENALLSKDTSNEEMPSQNHHLHLHLCDTDTENTSLLVNYFKYLLTISPDTFMVITLAGTLQQALRVFELRTLPLCWPALCCCGDSKHCRAALESRGTVSCCFHQHGNFSHH